MPPRTVRKTNKTILFAAEGDTELAFLNHLRGCYVGRDCNVSIKVKNAHGAGPLGIVDALCTGSRGKSYDFFAALFDSDIPLCDKSSKYFRTNNVRLFQSCPCIESTLLSLGNHRVRENTPTADCKRMLSNIYQGDSVELKFYERHFTKACLDESRNRVQLLDQLIRYMIDPEN